MNEPILDWKGNEVKAGMTIYFVETKIGIPWSGRMGILMTDKDGVSRQVWEPEDVWMERKNQDIWELGKEWLVVERSDGRLCVQYADGEMTVVIPFNQFGGGKEQTIAIKGISDTNI